MLLYSSTFEGQKEIEMKDQRIERQQQAVLLAFFSLMEQVETLLPST